MKGDEAHGFERIARLAIGCDGQRDMVLAPVVQYAFGDGEGALRPDMGDVIT